MDEDLQNEFRKDQIKVWKRDAWNKLCQASMLARTMQELTVTRNQAAKLADELDVTLKQMKGDTSPEGNTKQHRDNIKSLADTIRKVRESLETYDKQYEEDRKTMNLERSKAMHLLKLCTYAETYTYNAPPEAADAPPVEAYSAEAAGQKPALDIAA